LDARMRHDYDLFSDVSTIAGGIYFYHALQDRRDERGQPPDAEHGMLRNLNTGETWDGALFAENRFHFGRLSIVPGMRLGFLHPSVDAGAHVSKPLHSQSDFFFVPLFSLGLDYVLLKGLLPTPPPPVAGVKSVDTKEMKNPVVPTFVPGPPRIELYGTVAQAYRPITYGELVPTGPSSVVNGNLKEGNSLQFEYGVRGKPF